MKFFSHGLEEMNQELSKDGERHELGDMNTTPLNLHTLGLHTSNFCFSINVLYRMNLERLLFVCYVSLVFVLRPPLSFIYERAMKFGLNLVGCYYNDWGKGCLS